MGTRSLNETMDKNGLMTTSSFGLDDDDEGDEGDDDDVLNSCRSNLPVTTSSTCHHLD